MLPVRHTFAVLTVAAILTTLFATGCGEGRGRNDPLSTPAALTSPISPIGTALHVTFTAHPTSTTTPTSTPSPTRSPQPTQVITPTAIAVAPMFWTGPLLYDEWALAWARTGPPETGIPVFDLGVDAWQQIPTQEAVHRVLEWSPDGCYAVYLSGESGPIGHVHLVQVRTGEDRLLTTTQVLSPRGAALRWSPSGEWIAHSNSLATPSEVYLTRTDGSEIRRLTNTRRREQVQGWTADGQNVLYWSYEPDPHASPGDEFGIRRLASYGLETGQESVLISFPTPLEQWSDLVFTDSVSLQPVHLDWPGEPQDIRIIEVYGRPELGFYAVMTAQGQVEETLAGSSLYWVDITAHRVSPVFLDKLSPPITALSPDGHWLVLHSADGLAEQPPGAGGNYLLDMFTGEMRVMAPDFAYPILTAQWSADSTMLAGGANRWFDIGAFVYHLDTDQVTLLPGPFPGGASPIGWSPRMSYGPNACVKEK
jgi:hypothetical protein